MVMDTIRRKSEVAVGAFTKSWRHDEAGRVKSFKVRRNQPPSSRARSQEKTSVQPSERRVGMKSYDTTPRSLQRLENGRHSQSNLKSPKYLDSGLPYNHRRILIMDRKRRRRGGYNCHWDCGLGSKRAVVVDCHQTTHRFKKSSQKRLTDWSEVSARELRSGVLSSICFAHVGPGCLRWWKIYLSSLSR